LSKIEVKIKDQHPEMRIVRVREEKMTQQRKDERRFRLKVTGRGVGGVWVVICRLKLMRK